MKIILASSNAGKVREIKEYCIHHEVLAYTEFLEQFDIVEDGNSYKENALIKARVIYKKLENSMTDFVVISDDSGISVPYLGNIPGIYSARFAGDNASDKDNLNKLIDELKNKNLNNAPAYYTAAMAIVSNKGEFTVHGWMHGSVIDEARGEKGFGYDPMFIPNGYDKTLGELDGGVKEKISHRSKALKLAREILRTF